jgi:hypothetical protein
MRKTIIRYVTLALWLFLFRALPFAQELTQPIRIDQAVELATTNYPAIRAAWAQQQAVETRVTAKPAAANK